MNTRSIVVGCFAVTSLVWACGSGSDPVADDGSTANEDAEIRAGRKKKCGKVGGTCVALTPSSCEDGTWANASKVSCGGGVGVGCCVTCPTLSPPAPGFCTGGTIKPKEDPFTGCTTGYECEKQDCPLPTPPDPNLCPVGTQFVPRTNPETGCFSGYDCKTKCEAKGGSCVGLAPSSCPSGNWGDVSTHACGSAVGVGCCLP